MSVSNIKKTLLDKCHLIKCGESAYYRAIKLNARD